MKELPAEVLRCQVDSLWDALLKVLDTREKEAAATMSYQVARDNYGPDGRAREATNQMRAMQAASAAEREARLLLATLLTPNARLTGPQRDDHDSTEGHDHE